MYFDKNGEIDSLPGILADSAPAAPEAQALTQVPDKQAGLRRTKAKKKPCLKAVSFPVPNGEDAASVVSREQQYASFRTDNDNDIDFDVDNVSEAESKAETALVGAAGNKFGNTADLNVLNYKQSMESPHRDKYIEGIDKEQYKMSRNEVFEEVHVDDIPPGTKLLDSTWANKMKADGLTRCRLAIRGFQQIDGVHLMPPIRQLL
jgi:hypothetical protein